MDAASTINQYPFAWGRRRAFRARRWMARGMAMGGHRGRRWDQPPFGPWFGRRGGFPMGGFPGPFFGRGPRVARGDVRAAILALLAEEPMHGYQVIQELAERSGGVWQPSPGSVYPTLQQLEDEGLVRSQETDGRRVYHLTDAGRAEFDQRRGERRAPWEGVADAADESLFELRELGFGVAAAVMQVVHTGSRDQIDRAKEILGETRRRLYRLLAEDEPGTDDRRGGPTGDA